MILSKPNASNLVAILALSPTINQLTASGFTTSLLKHPSVSKNPVYNFSRVQLMWWTLIISSGFIVLFAETGHYNFFNKSTLIILAIGVITTASASAIDANQKRKDLPFYQKEDSRGFWLDILSDESGIAMHRLQAVIFNIIFGITFLVYFWNKHSFPDFNEYCFPGMVGRVLDMLQQG